MQTWSRSSKRRKRTQPAVITKLGENNRVVGEAEAAMDKEIDGGRELEAEGSEMGLKVT